MNLITDSEHEDEDDDMFMQLAIQDSVQEL